MFAKPNAPVTLSKTPHQIIPKLYFYSNFIKSTSLLLENSVLRSLIVHIHVIRVVLKITSQTVISEYMSGAFSVI